MNNNNEKRVWLDSQNNRTNKIYTITYRQKPIRNWSKCKKTRNVWLFY